MTTKETQTKQLAALDSLNQLNDYQIEIEVAYPFATTATTQVANVLLRNTGNTANRIDVNGDGYYISIQNDSVKAYLPFFGERRLSSGTYGGSDDAIKINEALNELNKQMDKEKGKLKLGFNARQDSSDNESYQISIDLYPNKNVSVNINPVYKTFMRYQGKLTDEE